MVSTLPPLLLLADKRPRVLDFILFVALFYFQCHFSLNLDELNYCRGLGTRALCRKKLIWKSADQLWWAISAAWRGAQEQVFIFRCQGYTHTHTKTRTSEKHAGVCHSFTSLTKTENRSSSPHCYLCFIRFLFFPMEFTFCFAFCFCQPLETHTEELNPNVALVFTGEQHPCYHHPCPHHRETWSALTSRSPSRLPSDTVSSHLRWGTSSSAPPVTLNQVSPVVM